MFSPGDSENSRYSDTEAASFGSSESGSDSEPTFDFDDAITSRQFLLKETPKISRKVLSTDKQDVAIIPNHEIGTAILDTNKSNINEPLDSKAAHNKEDSQNVDQRFQSHSDKINKTNEEIKNSLLKLKESQAQLQKLFEESKAPRDETVLEKIKKDVNIRIKEEEVKPVPIQMNIYQQIAVANFQIDKAQIQLLELFSSIKFYEEKEEKPNNNNNNSKMIEKANKAKEISEYIQNTQSNSSIPDPKDSSAISKSLSLENLFQQVETAISGLSNIQGELNKLLQM